VAEVEVVAAPLGWQGVFVDGDAGVFDRGGEFSGARRR
jgi:hypothetical protein